MAFDFNEARATIEEAKKRGLIRAADSTDPVIPKPSAKTKSEEQPARTVLPDWLRDGMK